MLGLGSFVPDALGKASGSSRLPVRPTQDPNSFGPLTMRSDKAAQICTRRQAAVAPGSLYYRRRQAAAVAAASSGGDGDFLEHLMVVVLPLSDHPPMASRTSSAPPLPSPPSGNSACSCELFVRFGSKEAIATIPFSKSLSVDHSCTAETCD
jgi:hypothetical protein